MIYCVFLVKPTEAITAVAPLLLFIFTYLPLYEKREEEDKGEKNLGFIRLNGLQQVQCTCIISTYTFQFPTLITVAKFTVCFCKEVGCLILFVSKA